MARLKALAGLTALALAGCVSKPAPAPAPAPAAAPPAPAPSLPVVIVRPFLDWIDAPLSAGEWVYGAGASQARFAAAEGGAFLLRCDAAAGRIDLVREGGDAAFNMWIRTSAGAREFSGPSVSLAASDPFLDAIAFSRGRFAVETPGRPPMILPTWPEPARLVEDCRS